MITGSLEPRTAYYRRYQGYARALSVHGIELDSALTGEDAVTEENGYRQMERLLANNPDMTAVVMLSNVMAVGAVSCLNEKRVKMPEQLAVVVIDNYTWSKMTSPPISVIDQPTYLLGQRASELLLKRLKNPDAPLAVIREPLEIIRRGSF